MDIINYFKEYHGLIIENYDLSVAFKEEVYLKGDILLLPNNRSKKIIFIESGLLRLYYQNDDKDITFLFMDENSFSMPIESIFYDQDSKYGLQVLEDCKIRTILFEDLERLMIKFPDLEKISRKILIHALKITSDKLYAIQFQTASQRYNYMIESYPNILLRAPLGQIASYLGITQQTLSVIRSSI
jgi:CRP-like cAMP-binding protein